MLKEGDEAPEIRLQNDSGELFDLRDLRGKPVILYFFSKANTPG
jgi:peroxiredoxin Q/BCP